MDADDADERLKKLRKALKGREILAISAATGQGIKELIVKLFEEVGARKVLPENEGADGFNKNDARVRAVEKRRAESKKE